MCGFMLDFSKDILYNIIKKAEVIFCEEENSIGIMRNTFNERL